MSEKLRERSDQQKQEVKQANDARILQERGKNDQKRLDDVVKLINIINSELEHDHGDLPSHNDLGGATHQKEENLKNTVRRRAARFNKYERDLKPLLTTLKDLEKTNDPKDLANALYTDNLLKARRSMDNIQNKLKDHRKALEDWQRSTKKQIQDTDERQGGGSSKKSGYNGRGGSRRQPKPKAGGGGNRHR